MPGFWRKCRIGFRCLRFTVWAGVLAALLTLAWFNLVGLPNFLKTRLVAALQERDHLQLEFSRMRLHFVHGIVAENVQIGKIKSSGQWTFTAGEVQLRLNYPALFHRQLQLDGIVLRDGKLTLPVSSTNSLALLNVQTELRFQTNDTWTLDNFHADFADVKISLAGEIKHAPEMQDWKMFRGGETGGRSATDTSLQKISDILAQIHFTRSPQLGLTINGDARDVHSFIVRLNANAPDMRTPWFMATNLQFGANLTAPKNALTNNDPALAWWTNLQPFRLAWIARASELQTEKINAEAVDLSGIWRAPQLAITGFSARLGGGNLNLGATLDVKTRELVFTNAADFDPHIFAELLPKNVREQLAEISWAEPPVMRASGSFQLPAWTNNAPDWRNILETTANLQGELALTNTISRGAALDSLRTHFSYTNEIFSLSDFSLAQGRTQLELEVQESEATKDFIFHVRGTFAATSAEPFLQSVEARHAFSLLHLTEPLALDLAGNGNLSDFSRFGATGNVALTNFSFRREAVDYVAAELAYTNATVNLLHLQFARDNGKQSLTADDVALDLAGQRIFITNGLGTIELQALGRAIGSRTARAMEPYHFLTLPPARVNGCIPIKNQDGELVTDDADLRVDILSEVPFRWHKFETPRIAGTIHWVGKFLIVTNVVADVYGGAAQGWGKFNLLTPGPGTDLNFYLRGTNMDFHAMGRALWSPTNSLEGSLSGWIEVTRANSDDWRSWSGFGAAHLHDGLLWDIPLFGLASPLLNKFLPGLGNSRATEATAQCAMTNGIIYSDSLEIRSLLMRLQYVGTVDMQENVNAKVTAQLLRNTWGVGQLMSAMLWPVSKIFECQVTGTLGEPQAKPALLIPRILMAPLHPIRSVEKIFTAPATNNPTVKP